MIRKCKICDCVINSKNALYCNECSEKVNHSNVRKAVKKYRDKNRKKRICPDCGIRELEYKCKYCSECAEIRRQIGRDLARYKWIQKRKELGLKYC